MCLYHVLFFFFFFNDTATTEIYTLSLHDALPISVWAEGVMERVVDPLTAKPPVWRKQRDRKSTRLNSSHMSISYAVFCLKKKKKQKKKKKFKEYKADNTDLKHILNTKTSKYYTIK